MGIILAYDSTDEDSVENINNLRKVTEITEIEAFDSMGSMVVDREINDTNIVEIIEIRFVYYPMLEKLMEKITWKTEQITYQLYKNVTRLGIKPKPNLDELFK